MGWGGGVAGVHSPFVPNGTMSPTLSAGFMLTLLIRQRAANTLGVHDGAGHSVAQPLSHSHTHLHPPPIRICSRRSSASPLE